MTQSSKPSGLAQGLQFPGMSTVILSRRQALATLVSAAAFAAPARAGLIVGSNGPLIGRAPGPVVSLERPQPVPRLPEPTEEAPAPVAAAKPA